MTRKIKLFICDVDGTLTDGKLYFGDNGELFKKFDIKDGYGIYSLLPNNKIETVIITGRSSEIVAKRCADLRVKEVYQGVSDKLLCLKEITDKTGIGFDQVAYIGDDLNDIECITQVNKSGGITACPKNSIKKVKKLVRYVCKNNGGDGAVREFIELIIKK